MKVAVISRGIPSAQYPLNGIFEFDQAKALAKIGVEVAFIAIDFRALSYKRKFGLFQYERDGVHVFELSLPIGVYRRALPVLQRLLLIPVRNMLKSFGKPDIVHAHFYSIAAIASILKRKFCIPFVVTEHSSKLNRNLLEISRLDARIAANAYQKADRVVVVSKALAANLKRNFGVEGQIIPNIVDVSDFQYVERQKKDGFKFISVGNLIKIKGFDLLIRAFAEAFKDDKTVKLSIVGDGPERKALQDAVNQYGIGDQITFLRTIGREKVKQIYYDSDAFVLSSRSETFGVVFIEAMATGLPVIATRCGGPESFVDENNGMLVKVNDVDELADAMRKIRANYKNYNPMQISEKCREKFAPDVVAEKIISVYNQYL